MVEAVLPGLLEESLAGSSGCGEDCEPSRAGFEGYVIQPDGTRVRLVEAVPAQQDGGGLEAEGIFSLASLVR